MRYTKHARDKKTLAFGARLGLRCPFDRCTNVLDQQFHCFPVPDQPSTSDACQGCSVEDAAGARMDNLGV